MKQRWVWGAIVTAGCAAWFVFAPTRVTDARVRSLIAEYGPLVEAETGRSFGDTLRAQVLTRDELRAHFEALNIASGDYVPTPERTERTARGWKTTAASTDWDALRDSANKVAYYDPRDHTIRVCSTNVESLAQTVDRGSLDLLKVVLLHELVHAVDGASHTARWIEAIGSEDESDRAAWLLVEGHAALVSRRLAERLGLAQAAGALESEWAESWSENAEYLRSAEYLERVEHEGGRAAIEAALLAPPQTIDAILYPEAAADAVQHAPPELWINDALLELAESRGDCEGPHVRELSRHQFEGQIYRDDASAARVLAGTLTQFAEVRGFLEEQAQSDKPVARACVFAEEEDAEDYLDQVRAVAEQRWRVEREQHMEFFDTLEDLSLDQRVLQGEGWEGVQIFRRWKFADTASRVVNGHVTAAGELELRQAYARSGRVVLELFPAARDGGPLAPVPRFDAAFALIDASR